jgi:hypothetical protein
MSNKIADEGNVFVCLACGKTSKDQYGDEKISSGWDESCMMNSREFAISRLVYSKSGQTVVKVND